MTFTIRGKLYNLHRLHDLAGTNNKVIAHDTKVEISEQSLLLGDCFMVTEGMTLPADAILVQGRVVVDESLLTGKGVPVTKTEFVQTLSDRDATHRNANILYGGTSVISVFEGSPSVGMVYRTGFRSARGQLISALLKPKTQQDSFEPEELKVMMFMVLITSVIFVWSGVTLEAIHTSTYELAISYLTALTIAVPPGLVACISIATSMSVIRLQRRGITVTDTMKIHAAGNVTYVCFDKTGTLTDERIVFQCSKLYKDRTAQMIATGINNRSFVTQIANEIMSTCHSLSIVDGYVVGDPLEVELCETAGWDLHIDEATKRMVATPPHPQLNAGKEHFVLRQFEFTPEKLRAVTLLSRPSSFPGAAATVREYVVLLKGSPEKIISM
eukprot:gene33697-41572_t